jgi:hypothetical protein
MPAQCPPAIRQASYAAFDINCLYRHDQDQVTITSTTPGIIQALINDPRLLAGQRTYEGWTEASKQGAWRAIPCLLVGGSVGG